MFAENRFIHSEKVQRIKARRKAILRQLDKKVKITEDVEPLEIKR